MFLIAIGVYSIFLAVLLGFFMMIKVNAYKFKALNSNVERYTKVFFMLIILLAVFSFSLIFYYKQKAETKFIDSARVVENVYY